jgi:cytochrome c-type biogenesis protein CcmH/NrfG
MEADEDLSRLSLGELEAKAFRLEQEVAILQARFTALSEQVAREKWPLRTSTLATTIGLIATVGGIVAAVPTAGVSLAFTVLGCATTGYGVYSHVQTRVDHNSRQQDIRKLADDGRLVRARLQKINDAIEDYGAHR